MKLMVVFDNNAFDPRLQMAWGFSAWVEYGGNVVLFDTGADGAVLLNNLSALGLNPQAIEAVVLSHIHGDHTGGLAVVLTANPQVTVYLPQAFPTGFKEQVRGAGAAVVEVDAPQEILPGLWSTGQMGTGIVEQALVARTEKGLVVVTGCAHPGVDEMVTRAKQVGRGEIALVVGGFHLGGASRGRVQQIISEFRRLGVQQVAPCHCTGDQARELFREFYGEKYHDCGVGWQW
jgi:7,8-dihydropterin-6-yl-methyl-4-(beta-D-ribofuranosyl)aminobenzene 5'-phosphate synthase